MKISDNIQNWIKQDRQCTYGRNIEARSRNQLCSGKSIILHILTVCLLP